MNLTQIEAGLQSVGGVTEAARLKGESLTRQEREFAAKIRKEARQFLSQVMINTMEDAGAEIIRRAYK